MCVYLYIYISHTHDIGSITFYCFVLSSRGRLCYQTGDLPVRWTQHSPREGPREMATPSSSCVSERMKEREAHVVLIKEDADDWGGSDYPDDHIHIFPHNEPESSGEIEVTSWGQ